MPGIPPLAAGAGVVMNEPAGISSGALIKEGVAVFRRNTAVLLIAGASVGLLAIGERIESHEHFAGIAGILFVTVLALAAQFAFQGMATRSVFVREGITDAGVPARFGAYIGTSALIMVGMMFGFMLLVVPGVLLGLRWALAPNFTLAREMGVHDAMKASRDMTYGHRGAIFVAYVVLGLVSYAPMIVFVPLAGGFGALDTVDPLSALGLARGVWDMVTATANLALAIGMFSVFVGRHSRLQEVFA